MNNTVNIDETIQKINKQNKRIEELVLEIERLNNNLEFKETNIKGLENNIEVLEEIIKKYENIIKEVREYITSAIENDDIEELKSARHLMLWNEDLDKLLEILDKVEEKE